MARRAQIDTVITGTDVGIKSLADLENGFARLGKTSQSAGAAIQGAMKEWAKPTQVTTAVGKLAAQVVGDQIKSAAEAVAAPAKTSYAQALAKANEYRDATQRIATSTGQGYAATSAQIDDSARRLGLLPSRVSDYGRSVRALTGDWQGAMSGMDAFQNRALKTDRTLADLVPTAAMLATTFGVKATADVNTFFGTLDRQAKNAGMSAQVAEQAFMNAAGALAHITNARPAQLGALVTGFVGQAPTRALGETALNETMGLVQSHADVFERRMQAAGRLGKGERLRDEWGQVRSDKLFDVLEFAQKDIPRFYGAKNRGETIDRVARTGMMSAQGVAGLMHLDVAGMRRAAAMQVSAEDTTGAFMSTTAGQRQSADVQKEMKDRLFGNGLLGMQDKAVAMGGGAAGVAIASAGSIFSRASDTFSRAVEIFAGKAAPSLVAPAAAAAGGAATSGGGVAAATGAVVKAGVAAVGVPALGAGALLLAGDTPERYRTPGTADERAAAVQEALALQKSHLADIQAGGFKGWAARTLGTGEQETRANINKLQAELDADRVGAAMAKALAGQTLRVQSVTPPAPPPPMQQPL